MTDSRTNNETTRTKTVVLDETQKVISDVGDGSNVPYKTLDPSALGIDEFLVDKLTQKPSGKYKFRRSIAKGGMKMVLEVRDMDTMRNVAMAVLPDAQNRPPSDILQFVQEARLTASLEHPNIVPVHDIGMDANGSPYFTMKLLRGRTLAALLTMLDSSDEDIKKAYPLYRLLRIFLKICSGVDFAHSRGVLHLDLKPENIQLGDFGEVLIIDWGLAKTIQKSNTDLTQDSPEKTEKINSFQPLVTLDGLTKGTPGYMAPEQARGWNSRKDKRTDVYALGAILYAMVTHKNPLEHKELKQMLADTANGEIIPPHLRTPDKEIPAAIEAVIKKAMSLNPEDRYATVAELREEVNNYLGGYATRAERATLFRKSILLFYRNRILASALAVILFIVGCGIFFAYQEQQRRAAAWQPICTGRISELFDHGHNIQFLTNEQKNTIPWIIRGKGIAMIPGEWMVLSDSVNHDWRLEVVFTSYRPNASLDIRLENGLLFRIGTDYGVRDQVCATDFKTWKVLRNLSGTVSASPQPDGSRKVIIQREGNKITFQTGNDPSEYNCSVDFLPPTAEGLASFAFHTGFPDVYIRHIELSTRQTAERTTPLIAADTLFEACLYERAFRKYLNIADFYTDPAFCDQALLKAYQIAVIFGQGLPDREGKIEDVRKRIAARKKFQYHDMVKETDAAGLWMKGESISALMIVSSILDKNPKSDILLRLLTVYRNDLSKEAASVLCDLLSRSKWLTSLDLSQLNLTSLESLRGLKLHYLDCSGNNLSSLDGLQGMPLRLLVTDHGIFQGPDEIAAEIEQWGERENMK